MGKNKGDRQGREKYPINESAKAKLAIRRNSHIRKRAKNLIARWCDSLVP